MLDAQGRIKVADFGISRSLHGVSTIHPLKGMVTGNLSYMGPQQLRGDPPAVQACLSKDLSIRPKCIEEVVTRLKLVEPEPDAPAPEREGSRHWVATGAVALLLLLGVVVHSLTRSSDNHGDPLGKSSQTSPSVISTAPTEPVQRFTNSLGMQLVGIPGLTNVLFGVHEVTVGNFTKFVDKTGHDADAGMYRLIATQKDLEAHAKETGRDPDSIDINGPTPYYGQLGGWKDPGFEQSESHPVVGMNRDNALAFCRWLTTREQTNGVLSTNEEYALPTDYQWSVGAGLAEEDAAAIGTPIRR